MFRLRCSFELSTTEGTEDTEEVETISSASSVFSVVERLILRYDFSSRFSFSTSVVRFRLSSFAACPLFPPVRSSER